MGLTPLFPNSSSSSHTKTLLTPPSYIASIEDNLTDSLQYFDIASSMDKVHLLI